MNAIIAIVACIIVFVILAINYKSSETPSSGNNYVETKSNRITTVQNMNWMSPLGLSSYTGQVNEGNTPNGQGIAKILEGQYKGCVYDGEFVNGIMEGVATYTQSNGDTFNGTFKDNKYYHGKYTIKASGEYFSGSFDNYGQPLRGAWYDKNGKLIIGQAPAAE